MMLETAAPNPEMREPDTFAPDTLDPATLEIVSEGARPLDGISTRAIPTVEHLLHAVALLIALAVRLAGLGATALSPLEAANSWQAWLDAMAMQVANAPQSTSALLHAMQTALFWVTGGGGNEMIARLPVALISTSLVLLPWYWRDRLGRVGAAVLAFLLALDPWLIALGRSADSPALSATIALIALTALHVATAAAHRALPDETSASPASAPVAPNSISATIAALALGLLLVSGAQAWSWLVVLAIYAFIADINTLRPLLTVRNGILFAAAALLGATAWLSQPQELRMVSASFSAWLARFGGSPYTITWPWLRLLVDQPFLLLFGIIGIVTVWRARTTISGARLRIFVTLWLGWGVVLMLLPGRNPAELPLLGLPLAIFAALGIAALLRAARRIPHLDDWRDAVLLGIVLIILQLSLTFWLTSLVWSQSWPTFEATVVLGLVLLAAALVAGFAAMTSAREALFVTVAVAGVFLLGMNLSAAYDLAGAAQPRHPTGFAAVAAHPDAHTLMQDVLALSSRRVGDATQLPVLVVNDATQQPDPQLGWSLRRMRNLAFADSTKMANTYDPARPPLVITTGAAADAVWNENYIGANYNLRATWLPSMLPPLTGYADWATFWSTSGRPWMRWLLYREAPSPQPDAVILWATP